MWKDTGDRLMLVRLVIQEETINVISAYAPQSGWSEGEKKSFWDSLDELVRSCPDDQRLVLGGDLNGHIGVQSDGYPGVHGGLGFGWRNDEGRRILDFSTAHDLIDYLLVRKGDFRACKDCKVLPKGGCYSQHKLLILDLFLSRRATKTEKAVRPRILWKNLMGEAAETFRSTTSARFSLEIQNGEHMDADQLWTYLAKAKKEVKKIVAIAKERAYEELYKKLDSKEGKNDIFRIAKVRERKRRDLGDVIYIKDESGWSIVKVEDIRKRWEEYFANLFNRRESGRSEGGIDHGTHSDICCDDDDTPRISQEEVRLALEKMGRNKATGPDQIPIEAWRCLGDMGISLLTSLFNKIWTSAKMPEEWRFSEVIFIYKNKGDVQSCSNFRGIKLLSHTMKLWERVIEMRLRRVIKMAENQFGFMLGRSTMEAVHITRSLMEKYRERQSATLCLPRFGKGIR
uniref:uncharacterized protein LOC122610773 n=1 Tax=Erigeron canadensis TaxID=72917 RepID=UPI001CB928BE|nr:uncharacterized protein LOC122610773 [Erigeron canadensis]